MGAGGGVAVGGFFLEDEDGGFVGGKGEEQGSSGVGGDGVGGGGVEVPGLDDGVGGAEIYGSGDGLVAGVGYEINVGVGELAVDEAEAFDVAGGGHVWGESLVEGFGEVCERFHEDALVGIAVEKLCGKCGDLWITALILKAGGDGG